MENLRDHIGQALSCPAVNRLADWLHKMSTTSDYHKVREEYFHFKSGLTETRGRFGIDLLAVANINVLELPVYQGFPKLRQLSRLLELGYTLGLSTSELEKAFSHFERFDPSEINQESNAGK